MKKKFLFFVLSLAIVSSLFGAFAIASLATTEQTEGYYTYTVHNGEATIKAVDTAASGEIFVPESLGGYPVTAIAPSAFDGCRSITEITVGSGIESIGMGAFSRCSSLASITLPYIGGSENAAAHAALFGYIFGTTPYADGVETTQYYAFDDGWRGFETYYIPAALKAVTVTGGTVGYGAFQGCTGLTSVVIENQATAIGNYAFALCANLSSVTLPQSVGSIGASAFWNCSALKTVTYGGSEAEYNAISFADDHANPANVGAEIIYAIPTPDPEPEEPDYELTYTVQNGEATITGYEGNPPRNLIIPDTLGGYPVTSIGDYAFRYCTSLESITFSDNVTSIGMYAFQDCQGLTTVNFGENSQLTHIGYVAFSYCTSLESITLPNSVTSIDSVAFLHCTALSSVTIPDSVTSLGDYIFNDCAGIETATVPALAISSLPKGNLKTVVITSGTSIPSNAFSGCTSLMSVTLPDSITSIGTYAFLSCTSLATVYYGGSEAEYNAISFANESSNPANLGASIVYHKPTETYTYTFFDEDGTTVLKQETAEKGATIVPPTPPTKPSDAQYTYIFAGWEGFTEGMKVTGDVSFKATYTAMVNKYTYTFLGEDGKTVLGKATVDYGTKIAAPEAPTKAATAKYTYSFAGWEGFTEGMTLTENVSFKASYSATVNKYIYRFISDDEIIISSAEVEYGTVIVPPANPVKSATAQYTYTFAGWKGFTEGMTVTGEVNFKATYTATVNKYTYTFFDEDGKTVLGTATVDYGTKIVAPEAPTKAATAQHTYIFAGWNGFEDGVTVTGDVSFKATYTAMVNKYTYTFFDEDGKTVLGKATVDYGTKIAAPEAPTKAATAKYTYSFAGWEGFAEGMTLTENVSFKASYSATVNKYIYRFISDDEIIISSAEVEYGTVIVPPANPVKSATAQYTYTFAGWEGFTEGMTVTGEVNFKATYTATVNKYTYTFFDEDGKTVLGTATVDYGTKIVAPKAPTKAATAKYTYTFLGYKGFAEGMTVTENTTFTATYTATVNKYTYTFFDEDGITVLYTETVDYGTAISAPANPTKAEDALYTYAFEAWLGFAEGMTLTGDVSFKASYTAGLKGTLSLESTTVSTAWGLEFIATVQGTQATGTGGHFVLHLDGLTASFVNVSAAEGVTVEREGNTFTITVTRAVEEGEALVTFTLKASAFLTSGEHSFLSLEASETASAALSPLVIYEMGDVNLDGKVNSRDVVLIKQHVVKMITLDDVQLAYANVYADEALNSRDAVLVQQAIVKMPVELGDRRDVSFVYAEGKERHFTVEHGEDLTVIPEAPEGYAWSKEETAYAEPTFTKIMTDMKYYLVRE